MPFNENHIKQLRQTLLRHSQKDERHHFADTYWKNFPKASIRR
jgi:hypothetical protein